MLPGGGSRAIGVEAHSRAGAAGHNTVVLRSGNHPAKGSLVGRVVYARQPVAGAVGVVVAKEHPLAELTLTDNQPVGWYALVVYHYGIGMTSGRQVNGQAVMAVAVGSRFTMIHHSLYYHAGAVSLPVYQVEVQRIATHKAVHQGSATGYEVVAIIQHDGKGIMQDILLRAQRVMALGEKKATLPNKEQRNSSPKN